LIDNTDLTAFVIHLREPYYYLIAQKLLE